MMVYIVKIPYRWEFSLNPTGGKKRQLFFTSTHFCIEDETSQTTDFQTATYQKLPVSKDFDAIVDGAGKHAKYVHEQTPPGHLEEESVADRADLPTLVQKTFGDQVVSVDGECRVVGDQQSGSDGGNLFETLQKRVRQ